MVTIQVFLTAKSCAGVLSKGRYGCSLSTIWQTIWPFRGFPWYWLLSHLLWAVAGGFCTPSWSFYPRDSVGLFRGGPGHMGFLTSFPPTEWFHEGAPEDRINPELNLWRNWGCRKEECQEQESSPNLLQLSLRGSEWGPVSFNSYCSLDLCSSASPSPLVGRSHFISSSTSCST